MNPVVPGGKTKQTRAFRRLEDRPLPWLAPFLLLFAFFYLCPLSDAVRLSFSNMTLMNGAYHYSLTSYADTISSSDFAEVGLVTAVFVSSSVMGQLLAGLLIAILLVAGERRGLRGATLIRSVVVIGWVLPGVVVGIVWRLLLDESPAGIITYLLALLGIRDPIFLSASGPALFWVIIADIWRGTAFSMILQYTKIKTIPSQLYEAAVVDGAGSLQRFLYITLPLLRQTILMNTVLAAIFTLNTFDMIVPLTGGGPGLATEVVALFIYNLVFVQFSVGQGAAAAVEVALVSVTLIAAYFHLFFTKEGGTT